MRNYEIVLAIDPSGNWEEGKGTTGLCLFNCKENSIITVSAIYAKDYSKKEEYWQRHIDLLAHIKKLFPNLIIVIEDFTLDPKRALQQSHSRMETPKLIGIMQLYCQNNNIPYLMQRPNEVKNRWADYILEHNGYIRRYKNTYALPTKMSALSRHCKDAIRHAVHYSLFKNKKKEK